MNLLLRIAVLALATLLIGVGYTTEDFHRRLLPSLHAASEVVLHDAALHLAALLPTLERSSLTTVERNLKELQRGTDSAQIHDLVKIGSDLRLYITDGRGTVLLHTTRQEEVGKDYSTLTDVSRALQGDYGSRSTRDDPSDPTSEVLYVAAPIRMGSTITGVLSVGKPQPHLKTLFTYARDHTLDIAATLVNIVAALVIILSWWIVRPLRALTRYAHEVANGGDPVLPKLSTPEFRTVGSALQKMRGALEDKKYVESYLQTLTHELRSPLSGIRGAAELLREDPPPSERGRFLDNITAEAERMNSLINRLLLVAEVEHRTDLIQVEAFSLSSLLTHEVSLAAGRAAQRGIVIQSTISPEIVTTGDAFLIRQAISNLLDNAISFSPDNQPVTVELTSTRDKICITVSDVGPGVPAELRERVFEKFFSLPRPGTGRKSSGLGLPFARRVAELHGGTCTLSSAPGGGTNALLTISRALHAPPDPKPVVCI